MDLLFRAALFSALLPLTAFGQVRGRTAAIEPMTPAAATIGVSAGPLLGPLAGPASASRPLILPAALEAADAPRLQEPASAAETLELMQAAPAGAEAAEAGAIQKQAAAFDNSVPSGLLRHGEHWVDLILSQGGSADPRYFKSFQQLARSLAASAKEGKFARVNEKIDGSPSIVLGFSPENRPFVSYKGDLTKVEKTQRLVTSEADAKKFFKTLSPLYSTAIKFFGPRMESLAKTEFAGYVFQGDLLFYENEAGGDQDRKKRVGESIVISANSIAYEIKKDHPYFGPLSKAKLGVVIHTVGRRVLKEGRVSVEALEGADKTAVIETFAGRLNSDDVFAVTPWKRDIAVATARPFDEGAQNGVSSLLSGIEKNLAGLSPEFKEDWAKRHESRFRIFFNSYLKPPQKGGIYLAASRQEAFSAEKILADFGAWLKARVEPRTKVDRKTGELVSKSLETPGYLKAVGRLLVERKQELYSLLESYYDAIRVQYLLAPHIQEIFRSKLGGGESEGVMLETADTIVKLVDRLGFTLKNNANWNRGAAAPVGPLPAPYDQWRPGAAFVLMKGQPVHSGHIEMIKKAAAANGGKPVFVAVSHKMPNLGASDWKELKITRTKKELAAGDYTYVFSQALRRDILEAGLGSDANVHFLDTETFWGYLRRAREDKAQGKVKLVVGRKEMTEHRYDFQFQEFKDQLEPLVVEMQEGGISATQVRAALKLQVRGTAAEKKAAKKTLEAALASIPKKTDRQKFLKRMAEEWRAVDEIARGVLEKK